MQLRERSRSIPTRSHYPRRSTESGTSPRSNRLRFTFSYVENRQMLTKKEIITRELASAPWKIVDVPADVLWQLRLGLPMSLTHELMHPYRVCLCQGSAAFRSYRFPDLLLTVHFDRYWNLDAVCALARVKEPGVAGYLVPHQDWQLGTGTFFDVLVASKDRGVDGGSQSDDGWVLVHQTHESPAGRVFLTYGNTSCLSKRREDDPSFPQLSSDVLRAPEKVPVEWVAISRSAQCVRDFPVAAFLQYRERLEAGDA